jgi:hypothetical protein
MKIKSFISKRSSLVAGSSSCALLLVAMGTFALSLASANASLAQGLLAAYEDATKPRLGKAPKLILLNPSHAKPDSSNLGSENLRFCNQMDAKPLGLRSPGGKNLVQFDRCYRGRLHSVCVGKALSVMFSSLQRDYEKLVETNYPAIASTSAVCSFKLSQMSDDFETTKAFYARYKALVAGFDERIKCTDLVSRSLEKATFPDLPNIEKTIKSMADELRNDATYFADERQAADELLVRITDAQTALEVHRDVHRAMCITAEAGPAQSR